MKPPYKQGYDKGLLQPDQKEGAPVPKSDTRYYNHQPADRDQVVWNDTCNFDHNLAHAVPLDGTETSVAELFKGKIRYT